MPSVATGLVGQVDFSTGAAWVSHALSGNPLGQRGRLLLRSRLVGHALGVDPPDRRGRRLLPPYAVRLVAARRCSVCLKLFAPAKSVPAAAG